MLGKGARPKVRQRGRTGGGSAAVLGGRADHAQPLSQSRKVWRWARQQPGLATTWTAVAAFYLYHLVCYWILRAAGADVPVPSGLDRAVRCLVPGGVDLPAPLAPFRAARRRLSLGHVGCPAADDFPVYDGQCQESAGAAVPRAGRLFGAAVCADLVGYVTGLALLGYFCHVAYTVTYLPELQLNFREVFPFALSLAVIGLIQYLALRRVRAVYETTEAKPAV